MRLRRLPILLLLVAGVLAFLTAETMARLAHRAGMYHPKITTAAYLEPNPFLAETLKPSSRTRLGNATIDVNSLGFRGEEFEPKRPPGVYRIFALGGSTTFGYPESILSTEQTFPYQLQVDLRERLDDPKLEVVNAGVTGYTLRTSLVNFVARLGWYEPDMIIVHHAVNDAIVTKDERDLHFGVIDANLGTNPWKTIRDQSFVLLELTFRIFQRWHHPSAHGVVRSDEPSLVTLKAYERYLRDLVALALARGTRVVLGNESLLIPAACAEDKTGLDELPGIRSIEPQVCFALGWYFPHLTPIGVRRTFEAMAAIQQRVANENGIPFVDVARALPKTSEYYWDLCHTTPAGAQLVAQTFADAVAPLILADRAAASADRTLPE